jgi:hypothetical protein
MLENNNAVFAMYSTRIGVENTIKSLNECGFSSADISVIVPNHQSGSEAVHEKHAIDHGTGTDSSAVAGGVLGWIIGIGLLAIPGFGPFIVAGPLLGGFAGATIGGIAGALTALGAPEAEAKLYEGRFRQGEILVSVHTNSWESACRARLVLKQTGGADITTTAETSSTAQTGAN